MKDFFKDRAWKFPYLWKYAGNAYSTFWNFLVARFTPQMFAAMGYGVYFFFASLMILSIPFVYFLIPETKSVPLESMDRLFERSLKPWKANKIVMREVRTLEQEFRHDIEGAHLDVEKAPAEHFEKM